MKPITILSTYRARRQHRQQRVEAALARVAEAFRAEADRCQAAAQLSGEQQIEALHVAAESAFRASLNLDSLAFDLSILVGAAAAKEGA